MTDDPFRTPLGDDDSPAGAEVGLPEHEIDENETVGGGVLGAAGTAIDRGTGEVSDERGGSDERGVTDAPDPAVQPFSPVAGREWAADENEAPTDEGPFGPGGEGDR